MIVAVTGFALLSVALGSCPNSCSGHGTCGAHDKCTCFARWGGADCSARQCPYGLSWVASVDNTDSPAGGALSGLHSYTSCSSRGKCTESGECECYPGYEGRGCRRTQCPNDCSGHGRCLYNDEIHSDYNSYVDFNSQHWDGHMTRQCVCDGGWEGFDCSERMCPHGDDPLTECSDPSGTSHNDIQKIRYDVGSGFADGYFTLTFTDMFHAEYTTRPIFANSDDDADVCSDIEAALEELPNFAVPNVTSTYTLAGGVYDCDIEFVDAANSGLQHTLVMNVGADHNNANMQPRFDTVTLSTDTLSAGFTITHDTSAHGASDQYEENQECSNRGSCDHSTGACSCYDGFTGEACHLQTVFF